MACSLTLVPPSNLSCWRGLEHGRTIPLADILVSEAVVPFLSTHNCVRHQKSPLSSTLDKIRALACVTDGFRLDRLKGYASYFWREWVTGVDHKRIGVMYTPLAMLMMPRGFNDAIIRRSQQAFVFREPSRT